MRKVLIIVSLPLLFAVGVAAGYFYAVQSPNSPLASLMGGDKGPATGLYRDGEVLAMRQKLPSLSLPISDEHAFVLLGIDRSRLGEPECSGWGSGGSNQNIYTWRLSPSYGIAMYEQYGRDFGPKSPNNKPISHIVIGKCLPAPGTHPEAKRVILDEADKEQTAIQLPLPGKGGHWDEWKYPNVAKTTYARYDHDNISGGFVCSTTDDFDKVLDFYYEKCGVATGTWESASGSSETKDGVRGDFMTFWGYQSDPAISAFRARCLNLKKPGYAVSITVVQAKDQKETQIFVNLW